MCEAREVFCRRPHCRGVIGWHILRPCESAYTTLTTLDEAAAAECGGSAHGENSSCSRGGGRSSGSSSATRWNWAAFTSGCKVPKVVSRRRCETACCVGCMRRAMDDLPAVVDGGDGAATTKNAEGRGQSLFARRVAAAWEQGRDLLWEVGWREQRRWPLEAERMTLGDVGNMSEEVVEREAITPNMELMDVLLHSFDDKGAATEHAAQQTDITDAVLPTQPPPMPSSITQNTGYVSPSIFFTEEFQPSLGTFAFEPWTPTLGRSGAVVDGYFNTTTTAQPGSANDSSHADLQLLFDGPVLEQGDDIWDALVGTAEGAEDWEATVSKHQRQGDGDEEGQGSHKRQRFG